MRRATRGGSLPRLRFRAVPEGKLRWCWLQLGGAALMLQDFWRHGQHGGAPEGKLGLNPSARDVLRRACLRLTPNPIS
jgi:hypothetical protein